MASFSLGANYIYAPKQWIYRLTVNFTKNGKDYSRVVEYPFNIQFRIVKNTFATTNTANFSISNLNESTREDFFKDRYLYNQIKTLTFEIGYESQLIQVFRGCIQEGYSFRSGTEIITKIDAWDIGQDGYVTKTFEAGTTYKEAVKQLVDEKTGLVIENTGNLNGEFKTPTTVMGKPIDAINVITNGHSFIDDGKINTLMDNECIKTGVTVLNSSTGLLGTPQRRDAQIVIESLLMPTLKVGQLLEIQSETEKKFNDTYFVCGFEHAGEFGGAKAGVRKTTINVLIGNYLQNSNSNLTNTTEKLPFMQVKGEEITEVKGKYGSDIEDVYNYIKKNRGNIRGYTKKITNNISWREMIQPIGSQNTNEQIYKQMTKEYLRNIKNIAEILQSFLDTNYPQIKLRLNISSGWRSAENNALWSSQGKASPESVHLRGGAIDFCFVGLNTFEEFNKVFRTAFPYFTYYYKADSGRFYIHVQNSFGAGGAKRKYGQ